MKVLIYFFVGMTISHPVLGIGGSEEKFIKKYAMMKVYESCFGPQVLKEIRREMREAAQKCSGVLPHTEEKYPGHDVGQNSQSSSLPGDWFNQELPYKIKPAQDTKVKKPIHTTDTLLLQQWSEEQKQGNTGASTAEHDQVENDNASATENESAQLPSRKPIDFSKLEEAILNIGRPMAPFSIQKPNPVTTKFQQTAAVGYYPTMYYPPPVPFPPSYPVHPYFPSFFQSAGPIASAGFPSVYRSGLRSARVTNLNHAKARKHADIKSQIASVAFHYNTKMRNISCILQELEYLDSKLEPNYAKMNERINKLQIDDELKKDMLDGVKFCKQFSQCIPETRQDSFHISRELLRPMFFFKCYKHKKLESCIMKDIRDRVSQTSVELNNEVRRSFKSNDMPAPILDSLFGFDGEELELPLF